MQSRSTPKAATLLSHTFKYLSVDEIDPFIREFKNKDVNLRYLFEYEPLSTAGGLFHYRDQITRGLGESDSFLLLNSDVCSLYPLKEMMKTHNDSGKIATILCVKSEVYKFLTRKYFF